jgi:hypothetical protein
VRECKRTFILSYVFEGKGEARVFALDDADFAKGAFADYAQQAEVVEVDWGACGQRCWVVVAVVVVIIVMVQHDMLQANAPWSVKTTGLPLL